MVTVLSVNGKQIVPLELTTAVGAEGGLSGLDRNLLKFAAKRLSPDEIADKLNLPGVTPIRVAQRIREILKSRDWLSQQEQKALLLDDMYELKEILFQRVRDEGGVIEDRNGVEYFSLGDPRWSANLNKTMAQLSQMILTSAAQVDEDGAKLRKRDAKVMGKIVEEAFTEFMHKLHGDFPDIEEIYLRGLLEDALGKAFASLQAKTESEDE